MLILAAVAVLAGALTTISGFGGGLVLLLAVAALEGAKPALVATSMALLVGNAHRIWLYRRHITPSVTVSLMAGLVPGALIGALIAASIPESLVQTVMLAIVGLSLARAWFGWEWRPGPRTLRASGGVVGVLAGSAGGAAFLVGPVVLAAGLTGRRYLATVAVTSVAMHVARITGYSLGGLVTTGVVLTAALLVPSLVLGNLVGDRLRNQIPDVWHQRIEIGAPVCCVALALAGVA